MLFSLAVLVAALPVTVLGGEFPVIEGVIGGTPSNITTLESVSELAVDDVISPVGTLRYRENTGVCGNPFLLHITAPHVHHKTETTPGVYSASGYADLTPTQHMWFWFFSARNDPDNAPLTIWLNGGVRYSTR
jgi:hypothetical protein